MSRSRKAGTFLLIAMLCSFSAGPVRAAICGFPGFVGAGIVAGGTNYVFLFSAVAPFPAIGVGTVPIGGLIAEPCRDIWRDSTLGPVPPNFNVVVAPAPAACAGACILPPAFAACTAPGAGGATICYAFP
jgi:hypothetical protein